MSFNVLQININSDKGIREISESRFPPTGNTTIYYNITKVKRALWLVSYHLPTGEWLWRKHCEEKKYPFSSNSNNNRSVCRWNFLAALWKKKSFNPLAGFLPEPMAKWFASQSEKMARGIQRRQRISQAIARYFGYVIKQIMNGSACNTEL